MPSLEELRCPANCQILLLSQKLSKKNVKAIFSASSAKATGDPVVRTIRKKHSVSGSDYFASLISFPISSPPSFFPKSNLKELNYSFLLLIEVYVSGKWYLGIFRKSIASIEDQLEQYASHLPRSAFTNAFSDKESIKRLSLQRMTVSKHELRAASYEADNLKTSLPIMATGRCAIRSIRFSDEYQGSLAITLSSSRVQQSGNRRAVDELASLVIMVATATTQSKNSSFLSMFAQAIPLKELPGDTEPNSILFDWSSILEDDSLELYRKGVKNGISDRKIKKAVLTKILGETNNLTKNGTEWESLTKRKMSFVKIAKLQTRYTVKSMFNNRIFLKNTTTSETFDLAKWVREKHAFSLTFNDPNYFYGNGSLYLRAAFKKEVEAVKRCLEINNFLDSCISEKGDPVASTATGFPPNSIFNTAENAIYNDDDWLLCMDLGDEWADYIGIQNNSLKFIHCKHGKTNGGASCFQEVLGQALKNLGRARCNPSEFESKLKSIYNKKFWGSTKIERLRSNQKNFADLKAAANKILSDPDSIREVHIVVTMLSVANFEKESRKSKPNPHFVQLIWLLTSFINSCREMGAKPVIVCKS